MPLQSFQRKRSPKTLILWGARAYLRDLPETDLHMLDSGHFAVEDPLEEIRVQIKRFHDERVVGGMDARTVESMGSAR